MSPNPLTSTIFCIYYLKQDWIKCQKCLLKLKGIELIKCNNVTNRNIIKTLKIESI